MDVAISIVVTLLLTLVNGFFSMSEMALVNVKRPLLERDAEEGNARAKKALELSGDSGDLLAAIQVAITLVGFASSAVAATTLSDPFAAWMTSVGVPASVAFGLAPVVITLLVSYFSIVIGELVPKRIALADCEGVSKAVAGFLQGFTVVLRPLIWITAKSANGVSRLLGVKSADERQNVSEEEIRYMVSDAEELTDEEKSMIHEIFDLGDAAARQVMVPRVDMTALEDTETLNSVLACMRQTGYSRIPIYHEDVDRIVGIAHIKDLISPIIDGGKGDAPIAGFVREADFVPDTKDIIPLLSEMQTSHDQMVIVVDEYGGTAGVITIEDIVEEVVGEIEDEFDPDNKYLTKLSEREWLVDGRFPIDDAAELGWPIDESDEYETVAGFILDLADGLPGPGEVFDVDGWRFRVQSMRGRRIALLRVIAPEPEVEPEDGAGGEEDDAGDGWLDRLRGGHDQRSEGAGGDEEPSDD
ncbi:hemolysin family protein [Atopobiaceae bacterium 24-176]